MKRRITVQIGRRRYRVLSWEEIGRTGVARCVLSPDLHRYLSADVIQRDLEITW